MKHHPANKSLNYDYVVVSPSGQTHSPPTPTTQGHKINPKKKTTGRPSGSSKLGRLGPLRQSPKLSRTPKNRRRLDRCRLDRRCRHRVGRVVGAVADGSVVATTASTGRSCESQASLVSKVGLPLTSRCLRNPSKTAPSNGKQYCPNPFAEVYLFNREPRAKSGVAECESHRMLSRMLVTGDGALCGVP